MTPGFLARQLQEWSCHFPRWSRLGLAGLGRYAEASEELGFTHGRFKMSMRHPSRDEAEIKQEFQDEIINV